jgi:amphiphysin
LANLKVYAPIASTPRSGETSPQPRKEASPESIKAAQEYAEAMRNAREQLVPDLDLIDRRVSQPAKELLDILINIKKVMTKRDHKLLDYDRYRGNLEKIKSKPEKSVSDERSLAKAEQDFQEATRVYTNINNVLLQELPIFLSYRSQFIDPCFQTLYVVQRRVFQTMFGVFERLAQISRVDLTTSGQEGWENRKDEGEDLLNQLGIIKGSWRTAAQSAQAALSQTSLSPSSPVREFPPDYQQATLPPPPPANAPGGPGNPFGRDPSPSKAFKPPPPPPVKKSTYVLALYDFEAQQDGDLSFKKVKIYSMRLTRNRMTR